jgi:hypothetical protein
MSGTQIAAQVAAGLAQAGQATGAGKLSATLRKIASGPDAGWRPGTDQYSYAETTVVQVQRKVRDGLAMTERTVRMLLIDPAGPVPAKGDWVAVGVLPAAVTNDTAWARIAEVETVAPGGVPVLFKAMLEE